MSDWTIETTEDFNDESFSITIENEDSFGLQDAAQHFHLDDFEGNTYEQDIKNYYNDDVADIEYVLEIPVQTGSGGSNAITISAAQVMAISVASSPKNGVIVIVDQSGSFLQPERNKGDVKKPDGTT